MVLDTNVLISACWSPGGLEAKLVQMAIDRKVTLCVTDIVLAEYRDVARRPKFAAQRPCFDRLLAEIEAVAEVVEPSEPAAAAPDDDDNRLLECAAGAEAKWLITGNLRHFPVYWRGTRIANARQFFDATATPG
jgi:putative PIN family toxin of toxin-antitoxin system